MGFYQHLKDTLKYPLCYSSEIFFTIFNAISDMFDDLKNDVFLSRDEFIPVIAKNYINYAKERNIKKFKLETEEYYHKRIIYAFQFYKTIQKEIGVSDIIKLLTSKKFIIKFPHSRDYFRIGFSKIGKAKIAGEPFCYIVHFLESITDEEKEMIKKILREYIFAHVELYVTSI